MLANFGYIYGPYTPLRNGLIHSWVYIRAHIWSVRVHLPGWNSNVVGFIGPALQVCLEVPYQIVQCSGIHWPRIANLSGAGQCSVVGFIGPALQVYLANLYWMVQCSGIHWPRIASLSGEFLLVSSSKVAGFIGPSLYSSQDTIVQAVICGAILASQYFLVFHIVKYCTSNCSGQCNAEIVHCIVTYIQHGIIDTIVLCTLTVIVSVAHGYT